MAAMTPRWVIVLLTAAAVVLTPIVVAARPTSESTVSASELTERIQGSSDVGWSGFVETSGTLQVPDSDSFANLAQLLGENNQVRVWWRSSDDWRADRIRSTGETDLFRQRGSSIRWVFESETATISPVSEVRLPDVSDLLPPTLGRSLLQGAQADQVARLPSRRVAGVVAPGLRLTPDDPASTVDHADLWADGQSGLPLRVEVYGIGDRHSVVTSSVLDVDLRPPAAATTDFTASEATTVDYAESVDVAAAANASAPFDLPTSLGGLESRAGEDPGAVGIYGHGPTRMIVVPLRGQVARPLRQRLQESGSATETALGTVAPVGPVGVLITSGLPNQQGRGGFLLAGTVTAETLSRAAAELLDSQ